MKRVIVAVAIFLILAAGTALAATPVGQWSFRGFSDLGAGPRQGICFVNDGTWYSTTFIGWHGLWVQNSDRIKFYGTTGVLSTAEFGRFTSDTRFTGQFAHFFTAKKVETSSSGSFVVTRTSDTCDVVAAALSDYFVEDSDPAIE